MRSGVTSSDDDHGEVPRNLPESDLASLSFKDLFAVFSISANAGEVPGIGLMLTRHRYHEKAVFGRLSPDFDRETFCRIFASGGPWDSFRDLARTVTPNYEETESFCRVSIQAIQLGQRLLDANRTIGQPKKITMIFGRKVTTYYKGKLQTVIEDIDLPSPVIRSHCGKGFLKQYVRDHLCLRTELAINDVTDYGIRNQEGRGKPASTAR